MAKKVVRQTRHGGTKVIRDTGKMTGWQKYRLKKGEQQVAKTQFRTSEAEKTARTKARAAAMATVATSAGGQASSVAKSEARERTKQVQIAQQYANLINGNQNQPNAAKPEDSNSNENQSARTAVEIWGD